MLRMLIGIACLCVIGVSAVWAYDRYQKQQASLQQAEIVKIASYEKHCADKLDLWTNTPKEFQNDKQFLDNLKSFIDMCTEYRNTGQIPAWFK